MSDIKLLKIHMENFMGAKDLTIEFSDGVTKINGPNGSCKSTIFHAFTWLMFNKDSYGREKFSIRTLDADGNQIHNTTILVEGTILVDGVPFVIRKEQTERYVKKRGDIETTLSGNDNSYWINDLPKTQAEFKKFIDDVIGENLFKMVTNPSDFMGKDWKDRRSILMSMVEDETDVQIAESVGGFEFIMDDLKAASVTGDSVDALLKKYKEQRKKLNEKAEEIPIRIDELSKSLVEDTSAELTAKREALVAELEECEKSISGADVTAKADTIRSEIASLNARARQISADAYAILNERRAGIRSVMTGLMVKSDREVEITKMIEDCKSKMAKHGATIRGANGDLEEANEAGKKLNEKWKAIKSTNFDESAEVCPTCGRPFDSADVEEHRKTFEHNKDKQLADLKIQARRLQIQKNEAQNAIKDAEEYITSTGAKVEELEAELAKLAKDREENYNACKAELDALPTVVEPTEEEQQIAEQIKQKQMELDSLTESGATQLVRAEVEDKRAELREIDMQLAKIASNKDIKQRIADLHSEQSDNAQLIMDCEHKCALLDDFIREKMSRISDKVNGMFNGIKWTLYRRLINGSIEPCCECTVNGVDYNTLNTSARIVAGLEIIRVLQKINNASAPIFIDNAECINDVNIPKMDCQMILLKVSDDEKLVVR